MQKFFNLFATLVVIALLVGCSGGASDPVTPQTDSGDLLSEAQVDHSGRHLLGMGEIVIDLDTLEAEVIPDRGAMGHINVTWLLPPLQVTINSVNWVTMVADVDATISNPHAINAYDIRLILYTNTQGLRLVNDDGWTDLYDIPGGLSVNPFKAYSKNNPNRIFYGPSVETENLQVFLPSPTGNIQWAIDASHPTNCLEPYAFENFTQNGILLDTVGSTAEVSVKILDWQGDVQSASINAVDITGSWYTHFTYSAADDKWKSNITNHQGAPAGEYECMMLAISQGTSIPLYGFFKITVLSQGCPEDDNDNCVKADDVGMSDLLTGCVDATSDPNDWYKIVAPPNGINGGTITLNVLSGTASMMVYSTADHSMCPGTLVAMSNHVTLQTNANTHYYVRIFTSNGMATYRLSTDITPTITYIPIEIYVPTSGAPNYRWPVRYNPYTVLTTQILQTQVNWANNFWNQYGYHLVWDGTAEVISSQYYNITSSEQSSQMHDTYGRGTGKASLYYVNSVSGIDTAYCVPRSPKSLHNVDNVYTVYTPNIWYWQSVIAHEHAHAIGYLIDQYLFHYYSLPCGDTSGFPAGVPRYLYADPNGCYQANLMWYHTDGWTWDKYELTKGQHNFMNNFHYEYPGNWPKY